MIKAPDFEEIIESFENLTSLNCALICDLKTENIVWRKIFVKKDGHRNSFCQYIKPALPFDICGQHCRTRLLKKSEKIREPYISECPFGVIELIVPFFIHEKLTANICCGQIAKFKENTKELQYVYNKVKYYDENKIINKKKIYRLIRKFSWQENPALMRHGTLLFFAVSYIADYMNDTLYEQKIKFLKNEKIQKAVTLIQQSRSSGITAESIAEKVGLSSDYFSKLFKKVTGNNFIDFIIGLKISKAKELLKNTTLPVIQIASEIGYTRHSFFTRQFSRIMGITPTDYRKLIGYSKKK